MISTTVNSQACWLLPYSPTADKVRLGVSMEQDVKRGLTGYSTRRLQGNARMSLEFTADLLTADFYQLRAAAITAQDEPILVPLWPHAIRVGLDTATMTGGLTVAWTQDWASWAINPSSLTGYDFAAPLLFGRFASPPTINAITDEMVSADFSINEDAPAAYAVLPATGILGSDTMFTAVGGYSAPIFPFVPEFTHAPQPGMAAVDVERSTIGPGRQKSTTYYPQTPEQIQQTSFVLANATEAAQLLAWWLRRGAGADSHWIALTQKLGTLSADIASGATVLNFTDVLPALGGLSQIALCDPAGNIEFARIASVGSQSITLAAALANSWPASWTTVLPAMLARHTNAELTLEYNPADTGWMASVSLSWRELSAEYSAPAGETLGTTLGRLTATAWFFQIDLDYAGAIASTYLTNWESGATIGGHTWAYNPCDFDKLLSDVDGADDSCTFHLRWFPGCPWTNWLPGQLAARGFLTISKADVDTTGALSNFRAVYYGELGPVTVDGAELSVKVLGSNALFAMQAPRQVMSTMCGTCLFKTRCGLALGDWTFNGTVVSVSGLVATVGTLSRAIGGGLPSGFAAADWFALGWLGWIAAGLPQRAGVLTSGAIDGSGHVALTLERPITLAPGTSITCVPGCDRTFTTCSSKFSNQTHFRGFPFMPAISPNFIIPQTNATSAKK